MNIEKRNKKLQEVRQNGFVPGVIYGKDIEATSVQVPTLQFSKKLHEVGTSKTFSILLDGQKHIVYIREYQKAYMDPSSYIHFDLVKVSKDDTLHSNVSLHFIGKEKFNNSALVFTTNLDEVEVEYNVGSGVSYLDIDVSSLTDETPLYVKDIKVPKGLKVLNNPDQIVCSLSQPTEIKEVEETEEQSGYFGGEKEE